MLPPYSRRGRDAAVSLAVGVAHAAWLFAAAPDVPVDVPLLIWGGGGLTLLGDVPVYLLLRRSLVTPVALVAWSFARVAVAQGQSTPHGPFGLYAVAWFVPLLVALLAGVVEYAIRRRTRVAPPGPLVAR